MTTRKIIILTAVFLALAAAFSGALQSYEIEMSEADKFKVHITLDRFTFSEDDPVLLNIHVRNISDKKETFVIFDEDYTTFQPVVYDRAGREAETAVPYRLMNKKAAEVVKDADPRLVQLSPNETVVRTVDLKKFYNLKLNTDYKVKGFFFLKVDEGMSLPAENVLNFKIVKSEPVIKRSGVEKIRREIAPSEVIGLVLKSEKDGNWDRFFKYIKVESYINAYSDFVRPYNEADEVGKLNIIEDFIKFLSGKRADYIVDFEVTGEEILKDRNIAYVEAKVRRFGARYPFVYSYRYTLEKYRDFWLVIDVDATVMKGEKP